METPNIVEDFGLPRLLWFCRCTVKFSAFGVSLFWGMRQSFLPVLWMLDHGMGPAGREEWASKAKKQRCMSNCSLYAR